MTSSAPEITPASPRGQEWHQAGLENLSNFPDRIQSRFSKALFFRPFTQDLNLFLTLNAHLCARSVGGASGHLDAREIVRRTTNGRQSANIWSFRNASVNYINDA